MKKYDRKNELVILGRRTNAVVSLYGLRDFNDIRGLGKRVDSKLFNDGLAQDYFFVTKGAVPWDRIPDFLIGREGFNPWLTAYAINSNLATLDVTNTVLALHQKSSRDTVDYECRTNKLASVNKDIIGPSFDYSLGRIDCARFFTTFVESNPFHGSNQSITISARNPNPCARLFELYGITNNTWTKEPENVIHFSSKTAPRATNRSPAAAIAEGPESSCSGWGQGITLHGFTRARVGNNVFSGDLHRHNFIPGRPSGGIQLSKSFVSCCKRCTPTCSTAKLWSPGLKSHSNRRQGCTQEHVCAGTENIAKQNHWSLIAVSSLLSGRCHALRSLHSRVNFVKRSKIWQCKKIMIALFLGPLCQWYFQCWTFHKSTKWLPCYHHSPRLSFGWHQNPLRALSVHFVCSTFEPKSWNGFGVEKLMRPDVLWKTLFLRLTKTTVTRRLNFTKHWQSLFPWTSCLGTNCVRNNAFWWSVGGPVQSLHSENHSVRLSVESCEFFRELPRLDSLWYKQLKSTWCGLCVHVIVVLWKRRLRAGWSIACQNGNLVSSVELQASFSTFELMWAQSECRRLLGCKCGHKCKPGFTKGLNSSRFRRLLHGVSSCYNKSL